MGSTGKGRGRTQRSSQQHTATLGELLPYPEMGGWRGGGGGGGAGGGGGGGGIEPGTQYTEKVSCRCMEDDEMMMMMMMR